MFCKKSLPGLLYPAALVVLLLRACGLALASNTCPVARNDLCAAFEDTPVNLTLVDHNDFDADADDLVIVAVTQPRNGQALIGHDGKYVTFVPDENFSGFTMFSYTISDGECTGTAQVFAIVRAINDAPIAEPDEEVTNPGTPVVIDVLANDFDVDLGDFLIIANITSPPRNGVATISDDKKTITYTPEDGFAGEDMFEYSITDGKTVSGTGELFLASAQVIVRVRGEKPVTDLCGATLEPGAVYYLEDDVACEDGERGPTLMDDTVLDCRGYSLTGNTDGADLPGIEMAGTGSEVLGCDVSGFHVGIVTSGANNAVRNADVYDFGSGRDGGGIINDSDAGPGNAVYCSFVTADNDVESYGIRSDSVEPFLVSGVEIEGGNPAILLTTGTVICADVSEADVGVVLQMGPVAVEQSVFNDSTMAGIFFSGGEGFTLSGVSSCDSAQQDIFLNMMTDISDVSSADVTCDVSLLVPCDNECPPNGRRVRLPSTCSLECPVASG